MEDFEDFALEVDSVVDLIVPIADEMPDAELADVQRAFGAVASYGEGPLREVLEIRAPVEANARRWVSSLYATSIVPASALITSMGTTGVSRVSTSRWGPRTEPLLGLVPYWAMGL